MSWKGRGPGGRGYHHGNLREALIQAALDLIAEKGPTGFTFAEAARSAGVSPAAPYRHFRDRDELLETAWDEGRPDPQAAFERMGRAYIAFARSEPAYYSAMFESGLPPAANPGLRDAGERAYSVLRKAAEALVATMPAAGRPPASMVSFHVWALSHGVASLFARADAGRRALPMSAEELLEAGMLVYLRGLGVPGA
jgi:AcrR family transcriptional regulator